MDEEATIASPYVYVHKRHGGFILTVYIVHAIRVVILCMSKESKEAQNTL